LMTKQVKKKPDTSAKDELRRTIVSCLGVAYPNYPGEKPPSVPDQFRQGKKTEPPAKGSRRPPPGVSKSEHRKVERCLRQIVATAIADADSLVEHIDQLAENLLALGCTTKADVEHYFLVANRTLVSLYFAARQPQPSPDELKRFALRYALDARRPVEGDLRRFERRRLKDAWEVVEHSSLAVRALPFRLPGRVLRDFYTVSVLDYVFARKPQIFDLMALIEDLLGGVPSEADGLAPNGSPKVERQVPRIKVDLTSDTVWLDGKAFQVKTGQAYFVDAVVAANRTWMSVKELASEPHRSLIGPRPDRVYKALPPPIRNLIEAKGGRGFRLTWRG
jgi:hypothetical protein